MPGNEAVMLDFNGEAERFGSVTLAGVDEAGRGPLAGPVVAAAVILPSRVDLPGLNDSKKLTPVQRERFYESIVDAAVAWKVSIVDVETIAAVNILQAALLAMARAVGNLNVSPDLLLIDGNQPIRAPIPQETVVRGDALYPSIAAASILAKVTRDRLMVGYHKEYPCYGFDRHKGYGTRLHRERIAEFGPCPIHRQGFRGVREFV